MKNYVMSMIRLIGLILAAALTAPANPCLDPTFLHLKGLTLDESTVERQEAFRILDSTCASYRPITGPQPLKTAAPDTQAAVASIPAPAPVPARRRIGPNSPLPDPLQLPHWEPPARPADSSAGESPTAPSRIASAAKEDTAYETRFRRAKEKRRQTFGVIAVVSAAGVVLGMASVAQVDEDCNGWGDFLKTEEQCHEEAERDRTLYWRITGISTLGLVIGLLGATASSH